MSLRGENKVFDVAIQKEKTKIEKRLKKSETKRVSYKDIKQ